MRQTAATHERPGDGAAPGRPETLGYSGSPAPPRWHDPTDPFFYGLSAGLAANVAALFLLRLVPERAIPGLFPYAAAAFRAAAHLDGTAVTAAQLAGWGLGLAQLPAYGAACGLAALRGRAARGAAAVAVLHVVAVIVAGLSSR